MRKIIVLLILVGVGVFSYMQYTKDRDLDNEIEESVNATTTPVVGNPENRAEWYTKLGWAKDCEQSYQELHYAERGEGITLYPFSTTTSLYLVDVLCYAGAYQGGGIVYLYDSKKSDSGRLLSFPVYDTRNKKITIPEYSEISSNRTINMNTSTIEVVAVARGLGDCGVMFTYTFDESGNVTLMTQREKECPTEPETENERAEPWPIVYQK